ncbi:ATP-dependent DNA helicase RecG [Clostridium fallax]|uniref:ATP-dependent DNA helicase RecG n=1 Tax=Clostridium fallax TaxID=1533 RepID=A0A1M4UUV4_9CLOT|nr:ATP-dependent DNA helicase RecG [Clostridium fallax]SHE60468.1 ATP-dependent DNA helicase RecG [Clostridium fallax]SQB06882.1 ATP-dependent DNA helicase RecG [Clostridium fallax]
MNINSEVSILKGVGPKLLDKLNKAGIFTVLDLLLYFPKDYEYINGDSSLVEIDEKEKRILNCKLLSFEGTIKTKTRKTLTTIKFICGEKIVLGKWFNQPYIIKNFRIGESYNLLGKFKMEKNHIEVINPICACKEALDSDIIPKYALKNELTNKILSKLINNILDTVNIEENLPKDLIGKYNLMDLDRAIRNIHFPKDKESLLYSIKRLKFQELFIYSMKLMALKKEFKNKSNGIPFKISEELIDLKNKIPFALTEAQNKVIREILIDEKKPFNMNRLVQGDVGSGKTIVALIALFNVYKNGYQVAMMAPTEILANQHYLECKKLFKEFDVDIEFLVGSTKASEKKRIKEKISTGVPVVIIGTHAIIQEDVEFKKLGLVITDEQHRFGVEQRSKLINKNKFADVLVMTATPIPRTLALYIYGDLDVSVIDKLPPGRKAIETKFFEEKNKHRAYSFALNEINKGRQVYIVCPLIEEGEKLQLNSVEKLYENLKENQFKNIEVAILHGKMKAKEKEEIIRDFKEGKIKAIISTTVIEVGVNVPNASVMIIENAERFGLSQLHQLRGRVGRGEYQSYCILIGNAKNKVTKRRMEIMTESNDGFFIAEQDLKLRGTGDMFGLRQHGEDGLILADLYEDIEILKICSREANEIVYSDLKENKKFLEEVIKTLERSSKFICFN